MNPMNMPGFQQQMAAGQMNGMPVGPMNGMPGQMNGPAMTPNAASTPHSEAGTGQTEGLVLQMNTYIYDYFIKNGHHQCARAMVKGDGLPINFVQQSERRDGEANGMDENSMDADGQDDMKRLPDDLPRPKTFGGESSESFLLEWFIVFWELFWAQRKKGKPDSQMYLQHQQATARMRDENRAQLVQRSNGMMSGQMNPYRMNGPRGDLQKAVQMQSLSRNMNSSMMMKPSMMQQQQMQREQSEMENGRGPQSPASADNAPSPSKRPRLEGGPQANGQTLLNGQPMPNGQPLPNGHSLPNGQTLPHGQPMPNGHLSNGQPMPAGRGQPQGMPGQPGQPGMNAMMNFNPQMRNFPQQNPGVQKQAMQGIPANGMMPNGMMPNQGSPMMAQVPDGHGGFLPMQDIYTANGQPRIPNGMVPNNGQNGNHALQDYQMQLMLLEQQNKKRLMMARQEHETMNHRPGEPQPGMPGPQHLPAGMSPQGSRQDPSPGPADQKMRGTPRMNHPGLPGSPASSDVVARGSPAAMSFNGHVAGDPANAQFLQMRAMTEGIMPPNMRPPSSNPAFNGGPQMEGMGRGIPVGNRVPGGNWPQGMPPQGQPMMQQQSQPQQSQLPQAAGQPQTGAAAQPPAAANAQERNQMPPPQAPTGAAVASGRAQPPSPQGSTAAPPTPQQASKPNPKTKKEADKIRKRNNKKATNTNNAAATPSSDPDPPPTPTPSTPLTPAHPPGANAPKGAAAANANSAQGNAANASATAQAPAPAPASVPAQASVMQAQAPDQMNPFDMTMPDQYGGLGFDALEDSGVGLDNFDFDSFLNTQDDTSGLTFDQNIFMDGVETDI